MYFEIVPPAQQAVARAQHLLGRVGQADASVLSKSLAPDMFDFQTQLAVVAGFALRATLPVTGREVPDLAPDADLLSVLDHAATILDGLTPDDFNGAATCTIAHQAGTAELRQTGAEYVRQFALPNLWFHLSMAYAIARHHGVAVGKADFDGLHAYAPGFSFVSNE